MDLFDLKERLGGAGALITFSGSFSHSIIEELGTAVKKYLESEAIRKSAMLDVFSVYIEAAQNVRNYTAARLAAGSEAPVAQSSILVIAKRDDRYEVHSGNVVEREDVAALTAQLDEVSGLDPAGLRALYKERLRRRTPDGATGAGLGFVDMARRATEPLHYQLTPLPDGRSYFSLRVVV